MKRQLEYTLDDVYRENGLICFKCNKPYINPQTCTKCNTKFIACNECWSNIKDSNGYIHDHYLWGELPTQNKMEQMKLCWDYEQGYIDNNDIDWQNELVLRQVINGNWNNVRQLLGNTFKRKWNNMSMYVLIEACEHSDVPEDIIELLLDCEGNTYSTRPCINPCGIGAMIPVVVAAEKGSINALNVFKKRNMYSGCDLTFAASCAIKHGQAEALDILWSQSRSTYYNDNPKNIYENAYVGEIVDFAEQNNYTNIIEIVKKYLPNQFTNNMIYKIFQTQSNTIII